MRIKADLTLENLEEGNESLKASLDAVEDLLQRANEYQEEASGREKRKHPGGGSKTRKARSPKEEALSYFGFSMTNPPGSKAKLREVWAKRISTLHPDKNPDADDAELSRLRDELEICQKYYNELLIHFSWHRPA